LPGAQTLGVEVPVALSLSEEQATRNKNKAAERAIMAASVPHNPPNSPLDAPDCRALLAALDLPGLIVPASYRQE
jgi:hypothetical protein